MLMLMLILQPVYRALIGASLSLSCMRCQSHRKPRVLFMRYATVKDVKMPVDREERAEWIDMLKRSGWWVTG